MLTYENVDNVGLVATTTIVVDPAYSKPEEFQVTINPSVGATGTVTPTVKARGSNTFEAITDNGVAVSVNLAAPLTFRIFGMIDAIKLTPTNLVGSFSAVIHGFRG